MPPEHIARLKNPVAELIADACARFVLPRFQALKQDQIQTKSSPNDLVTIADIEAEAWLAPQLCQLIPGSVALGEEAASRGEIDSQIMAGEAPIWVIDPVDGTYNFAHGNSEFCCMVALIIGRQVLAGWIYFPTEQCLFWAGRGLGAVKYQNGQEAQPLNISTPPDLGALSHRFFNRPDLKGRKSDILSSLSPTQPTRCAGMDYRRTAEGTYGFVAMASLTPWDHAPGTLLVTEAGGQAWLNGGPYDPKVDQGILITGANLPRMQQIQTALSAAHES